MMKKLLNCFVGQQQATIDNIQHYIADHPLTIIGFDAVASALTTYLECIDEEFRLDVDIDRRKCCWYFKIDTNFYDIDKIKQSVSTYLKFNKLDNIISFVPTIESEVYALKIDFKDNNYKPYKMYCIETNPDCSKEYKLINYDNSDIQNITVKSFIDNVIKSIGDEYEFNVYFQNYVRSHYYVYKLDKTINTTLNENELNNKLIKIISIKGNDITKKVSIEIQVSGVLYDKTNKNE